MGREYCRMKLTGEEFNQARVRGQLRKNKNGVTVALFDRRNRGEGIRFTCGRAQAEDLCRTIWRSSFRRAGEYGLDRVAERQGFRDR